MTLIQPCIPGELASTVIEEMQRVLGMRHRHQLTRQQFLGIWAGLRGRLQRTYEYQAFRRAVWERDGGRCVMCRRRSRTVHHRVPVSYAPDLACEVKNGELRCKRHHEAEHPHMRKK